MATTARPLYFRSFEAALRQPPSTAEQAAKGWGAVAEYALQLLHCVIDCTVALRGIWCRVLLHGLIYGGNPQSPQHFF